MVGAVATGTFAIWRLLLANTTDDDNTVRFKILYVYLTYVSMRIVEVGEILVSIPMRV